MTPAGLDDAAVLARVDASGALADVEDTPGQWRRAAALEVPRLALDTLDAVVVCGMGGSGIGGEAAAALADDRLPVPVMPRRGFDLPAFVGARSAVVVVSYSGGTEETLAALAEAHDRGARVLGVSTGGALAERCAALGHPCVTIPERGLQPRHAFGWLAVPVLRALGLDDAIDEAVAAQHAVLADAGRDVPTAANPLKGLALRLADAPLVVAYATSRLAAVASRRLAAQLNENAKRPAHTAELPELGHNEIVAWEAPSAYDGAAVVWVRDRAGEHPRVAARVPVVDRLLAARAATVDTLEAGEGAPLARLARLLLQADLTSVYTAVAREQDPTPIASIVRMKEEIGP